MLVTSHRYQHILIFEGSVLEGEGLMVRTTGIAEFAEIHNSML